MAYATHRRRGIWEPIRLIATFVGLAPGRGFAFVPVAVGGAVHLGLSAAYGGLYAVVVPDPPRRSIVHGVAYGLLLHVVNMRIMTRARRFSTLRTHTNEPVELLAHALYGAALAARLRGPVGSHARAGISGRAR